MTERKCGIFDRFRCIAGDCPDSCCKEWEVQVDKASAETYLALDGTLGDLLRSVLRPEEEGYAMTIQEGRCPMWRQDGLCRIQAELGEAALCHTCREFPRLLHDYGDFRERTLELSCPEAARLLLTEPYLPMQEENVRAEGKTEYDREAMEVLLATRQRMLELLADESRPVGQSLALGLLYGCQAQSELDCGEMEEFREEAALQTISLLAKPGKAEDVTEFFKDLEILTEQWRGRLERPDPGSWKREHLALARYFVERYWLQAVSDYDLYSRVKLTVISCLTVKLLGGDTVATAQLYSKEIENNMDNLEAILDAAYTYPAFTDDKLLGMLLEV